MPTCLIAVVSAALAASLGASRAGAQQPAPHEPRAILDTTAGPRPATGPCRPPDTAAHAAAADSGVAWDPEQPPVPLRRSGPPYAPDLPEEVRSQYRTGLTVLAAWVVDTAGVPEPATIVIVASPDARLSASVCRFVPTMRFQPARSAGLPVRARYELPFTFNSLRPGRH